MSLKSEFLHTTALFELVRSADDRLMPHPDRLMSLLSQTTSDTPATNAEIPARGRRLPASSSVPSVSRFNRLPSGDHKHVLSRSGGSKDDIPIWKRLFPWKTKDDQVCFFTLSQPTGPSVHQQDNTQDLEARDWNSQYAATQELLSFSASSVVQVAKKVKSHATEELFAVKTFRHHPRESTEQYRERVIDEYRIWRSSCHANVIETLELILEGGRNYQLGLAMEFCDGGNLFNLINTVGRLDVEESDCFFKQLILGVQHIHSRGVVHRNLKPRNILLTCQGRLKITDFGCAEQFRRLSEDDDFRCIGLRGSLPYIAPEAFTLLPFDARAADMWALGIIYFAMISGTQPWRMARSDDPLYTKYLKALGRGECAQLEAVHGVSV